MATRHSPEYSKIAAAFIAGDKVPASSKTANGLRRLYIDLYHPESKGMFVVGFPALFSYGPHYPAVIQERDGSFLLNETDYAPSQDERYDAGYQSALCGRPPRRVKFSPTTRRQLDNIADELRKAGKTRTDETVTIGEYTYRVWS